MKYLIGFIFLFFSHLSYSKQSLPEDCSYLKDVVEADLVLFNKKEFIQLGECLAVNRLKTQSDIDLVRSCKEVDEDRRNYLGILSLSKLEAILIGQCIGSINYIYEHYNNEFTNNWRNSSEKYTCIKGKEAVYRIMYSSMAFFNRANLRNRLCYVN
jgi:hypothetical protein